MKISYRREMKHNYLIVAPEELDWKHYECSMLAQNSMEGVLHFQLRQIDDEVRFYYEITSRQPLERLLENQSLKAEELRRLNLGISAVLDRMEQYLLRESRILLEPEYIYVEPESFRVWLCLIPGLERNFPEDYAKLLEYLLGKADHQDKESVVLAYGLYQETKKENYGMEDILRILRADADGKKQTVPKQEWEEQQERPRGEDYRAEFTFSESGNWRKQEMQPEYGVLEPQDKLPYPNRKEAAPAKKTGIWRRLFGWLKRKKAPVEQSSARAPMELLFREEDAAEGQEEERKQERKQERIREDVNRQESLRQQERRIPAQAFAEERDTVLLADFSQAANQGVRRLRALDKTMEDIPIPYFPFIIGKQEHLADYLLLQDTVSRLHVRIDREGDGWKIQDLNSTNGTIVRGRFLDNNETVPIAVGDEVQIAEFHYLFE